MIGFITAVAVALALIGAYIAFEVWQIKKYGMPELPDEIRSLDARIDHEP